MNSLETQPRRSLGIGLIAGLLACALTLTGCSSSSVERGQVGEDGTITLRFAHQFSTRHAITKNALEVWMKEVEDRTDGRVKFEYFPAGQLIEANDVFPAIRSGVIDVGFFVPANAAGAELPLSDVTAVPGFGAEDSLGAMQDAYWELLTGILGEKDYLPKKVRPLMGILAGKYQVIAADEPVRTLDDWRGLTVRSAGGASDFVLSNLAAASVHLASGEVYEALQRGTIDGGMNTLESIPAAGYEEVANSASTNAPFGAGPTVLSIRDEVWQNLPADVQQAMEEARVVALETLDAYYANENAADLEKLSSEMEFYELTDEELAAMGPAMKNAQDQWVAQRERPDKPAREVLDAWIAALGRLHAQSVSER
ncbi:TRAP transporter substrate-binding protein DctP [Rhodococcus opacus]|uniref:TRAP transporter substrate-binding protein DctP n=1 Tax=Rhodococcus opacus TaxID=37919 RepID=UPI001C44323D|nr:TRAP transporter substrate-binding protein DctP [Rhodococcus opacus]MBV6759094.1 TRAP transporter substrate-binding protein DctP [Rhodococcus opacus]